MKPLLKWCGSKRSLAPILQDKMPLSYGRYIEPMVGAGGLFFAVEPKNAVICDANDALIDLYFILRDCPTRLLTELAWHKSAHTKRGADHYYETRTRFNSAPYTGSYNIQRAGQLVYLNKACFNGLWRVNKSGKFNVPVGDYADPKICDEAAIQGVSRVLQGTQIKRADVLSTFEGAVPIEAGDFVYFDPPYDKTFSNYTKNGFGEDAHRTLADLAGRLAARGAHVMLSLSDTPLMQELYESPASTWRVDRIQARRSVNRDGANRKSVTELVIRSHF